MWMGIDRLLQKFSKHKRLILMYHGVIRDPDTAINGRHLPINDFEEQLIYFKRNFDIVRLAKICEMQHNGILPEKHTIALTFDDGFLNNISNALPLLKKYQIPATFFICTASLDDDSYIHPSDYLDLINFSQTSEVVINGKVFRKNRYHLSDIETKRSVYEYINSLSFHAWKKTLSDLRLKYPAAEITRRANHDTYKLITGTAFSRLLKEELITIGSHGHWHVNLAILADSEVREQLDKSKQLLMKHGIGTVESVAFPYGYFNEKVLSISREVGYRYLIAGGSVEEKNRTFVFPRKGVLNLAGSAFNILSINRGFNRFGF